MHWLTALLAVLVAAALAYLAFTYTPPMGAATAK